MTSAQQRPPDSDGLVEPLAKRQKIEEDEIQNEGPASSEQSMDVVVEHPSKPLAESVAKLTSPETLLPPSRVLLGAAPTSHAQATSSGHTVEFDVGISEYISKDLPAIHAIIKQRFTDFLVNEVNLEGEIIHIKSMEMPQSDSKKPKDGPEENISELSQPTPVAEAVVQTPQLEEKAEIAVEPKSDSELWPEHFTSALRPYLSEPLIAQLKEIYLEGPEPPFVSDGGWAGRQQTKTNESADASPSNVVALEEKPEAEAAPSNKERRGKRGRDRGGRGGRGGGRRGDRNKPEDHRRVVSDPMESKAIRTAVHKTIRDLFGGKLESETEAKGDADVEGRITIKWGRRGQGRDAGRGNPGNKNSNTSRGAYPPYIHFTLQKTNRDTQDALGHISRMLHCTVKDLSFAGTKDKRGVTVQRISLRRHDKAVEDVWKAVNGCPGRKTLEDVLRERGERGVRISDLNYRKAGLELGMLKGNVFVITLRNVQVEPLEALDKALNSLKHRGFINYYGMQRFGTASIPTHSIGLAFLQSDWQKAIQLLLSHRPGEHPDVVAARDAWLVEKDLDKALSLMPRRVVAERCILESFKKQKGDTRNAMGALSTIPRNLRLMYIHAYQSYVWNAIVSERIRSYGADKPVPGDIVFEKEGGKSFGGVKDDDDDELPDIDEDDAPAGDPEPSSRKVKRPWVAPQVKILTEEDVDKYSIFDVIMPLPGTDVAYPGGALGERYRDFLRLDGLDPENFVRKQRDYTLGGSYRKVLNLPKELSWKVLRYTDPDVPLAQSDEDQLLGFESPVIDENGKFIALQVELQLGTAAYATMALREVTKTETSSHYQTSLTQSSEDQAFRGTVGRSTDAMDV